MICDPGSLRVGEKKTLTVAGLVTVPGPATLFNMARVVNIAGQDPDASNDTMRISSGVRPGDVPR